MSTLEKEETPKGDVQTFTSTRRRQEWSEPGAGGSKRETGAQITGAEDRGAWEGGGEEGPEAASGLAGTPSTWIVDAGS